MIMHQSYILYQYIHMHAVFYMFNNPLSASGVVQLLDNTDWVMMKTSILHHVLFEGLAI